MEALTCPQCSAAVDPPADRTQFFCRYCGATVVVPERLRETPEQSTDPEQPSVPGQPSVLERPLEKPVDLSKFTVDKSGDYLMVMWRWRGVAGCFLVGFAAFWNTFLVVWTAGAASASVLFALFSVPFWIVGLGMAYLALAMLVNRTEIVVDDQIRIWHGPLPWKNPAPVPVDRLTQLFVFQRITQGKYGPNYSYELQALQQDGPVLTLLKGESTPDVPRAIERLIEVHLGIDDQRVQDEHG